MTAPPLLALPEVAARLHKSTRWMQYFLRDKAFGRMAGRTRLFTEGDVAALIEALPMPSSATAPASSTCAAPSEASLWTKAQKLTAAGRKANSGLKKRASRPFTIRHRGLWEGRCGATSGRSAG